MKIKYTILGKHKFLIFTNRKYGLLTLYKILNSKVHPIISKDNQRLPKTAKDSQSKVSVSWCPIPIVISTPLFIFGPLNIILDTHQRFRTLIRGSGESSHFLSSAKASLSRLWECVTESVRIDYGDKCMDSPSKYPMLLFQTTPPPKKTWDVVAKNRCLGQYVQIEDRGHVNCDDDACEKGNNHIANFVGFGKWSHFLSMAAVGSVRIKNSDEGMD